MPFPPLFPDFDELGLRLGLRLGRGVPFRNLTCLWSLALVAEAPLNGFFVKDRCRDLDVDDERLEPEDDAPEDLTDLDGFRPLCVVLSLLFLLEQFSDQLRLVLQQITNDSCGFLFFHLIVDVRIFADLQQCKT